MSRQFLGRSTPTLHPHRPARVLDPSRRQGERKRRPSSDAAPVDLGASQREDLVQLGAGTVSMAHSMSALSPWQQSNLHGQKLGGRGAQTVAPLDDAASPSTPTTTECETFSESIKGAPSPPPLSVLHSPTSTAATTEWLTRWGSIAMVGAPLVRGARKSAQWGYRFPDGRSAKNRHRGSGVCGATYCYTTRVGITYTGGMMQVTP